MRFNTLFFVLILSCVCLALAQMSYDDCCLRYVRKMEKRVQKHAVGYTHQKTDGSCNIPAVIFNMRKGKKYCTNPSEKWVKDLMQTIDGKTNVRKPQKKHPHRG